MNWAPIQFENELRQQREEKMKLKYTVCKIGALWFCDEEYIRWSSNLDAMLPSWWRENAKELYPLATLTIKSVKLVFHQNDAIDLEKYGSRVKTWYVCCW